MPDAYPRQPLAEGLHLACWEHSALRQVRTPFIRKEQNPDLMYALFKQQLRPLAWALPLKASALLMQKAWPCTVWQVDRDGYAGRGYLSFSHDGYVSAFLCHLLRTRPVRRQMQSLAFRKENAAIDSRGLASLILPRPARDEQLHLCALLEPFVESLELTAAERELTCRHRDAAALLLMSIQGVREKPLGEISDVILLPGSLYRQYRALPDALKLRFEALTGEELPYGDKKSVPGERKDCAVPSCLRRYLTETGDLIWCLKEGRIEVRRVRRAGYVVGPGMGLIRRVRPPLLKAFVREYLCSPQALRQCLKAFKGQSLPFLKASLVRSLKLPVPSPEEQRRVVRLLLAHRLLLSSSRLSLATLFKLQTRALEAVREALCAAL